MPGQCPLSAPPLTALLRCSCTALAEEIIATVAREMRGACLLGTEGTGGFSRGKGAFCFCPGFEKEKGCGGWKCHCLRFPL